MEITEFKFLSCLYMDPSNLIMLIYPYLMGTKLRILAYFILSSWEKRTQMKHLQNFTGKIQERI